MAIRSIWKCVQNYDSSRDGGGAKRLAKRLFLLEERHAARVKNKSTPGTTRLEFRFEDLHNLDRRNADYDYKDYNFEISIPAWVTFQFGGLLFGGGVAK